MKSNEMEKPARKTQSCSGEQNVINDMSDTGEMEVSVQRWTGGGGITSQVGTGRRSKRLASARNPGPHRLSGFGGGENHPRTRSTTKTQVSMSLDC